jgi:uncharacterized membrane protein HdeD (DUF308 family)
MTGFESLGLTARSWRAFVLRGLAAIVFGLFVFTAPELGLMMIFRLVLGARMAIEGACSIYQAARGRHAGDRASPTWLWVDGNTSLIAASVMLVAPGMTSVGLLNLTIAWLLLSGAARLMMASRSSSVMLGLLGAVSILISVWLLFQPWPGPLTFFRIVALESVITGTIMILIGWRLRRIHKDPQKDARQTRI